MGHADENQALVRQLRQRAARHRAIATSLTSEDATIVLREARQAEEEAERIVAELTGQIGATVAPAPLNEYVAR
jgi:hypothetical protein